MFSLKILNIFAILSISMLLAPVSPQALADETTSIEDSNGPTFTSEGTVNSFTGVNNSWLLGGVWNIQAINGVADTFDIDITMIASNGTMRHHMLVTNFTQAEKSHINMTNDGTININGTSDIYGHGKLKWSAVPSEVTIDKYNVLHVVVDNNKTENHFLGGLHGITNSFLNGFDFNKGIGGAH